MDIVLDFADNDWDPLFLIRVLWRPAVGFYGSYLGLAVWIVYNDQVLYVYVFYINIDFNFDMLTGFFVYSVRTPVSMQYFPRFFFLYFMIFHIYFFSYEYGK